MLPFTLPAQATDRRFSLSGGFKIGAPINQPQTNLFETTGRQENRWTGGPAVELQMPKGFGLEFNALYRNYRERNQGVFTTELGQSPFFVNGQRNTNVWDLPLLVKYRFRLGPARPFVSGGYQWTRESFKAGSSYQCTAPQGGSCVSPAYPVQRFGGDFSGSNWKGGLAAGAGLEFKTRYVTISPEVRWTRPREGLRENRVFGLAGFTFGKR